MMVTIYQLAIGIARDVGTVTADPETAGSLAVTDWRSPSFGSSSTLWEPYI